MVKRHREDSDLEDTGGLDKVKHPEFDREDLFSPSMRQFKRLKREHRLLTLIVFVLILLFTLTCL